jgi:cytoskeletal protein RodZ
MEKSKSAIIKSAKKIARKNIELSLIAHLKEITVKTGPVSKKLIKEIEKGAKKLAKSIAKELVLAKPLTPETVIKTAAAATPAPAEKKPEVKKAPAAKPAASKPVK